MRLAVVRRSAPSRRVAWSIPVVVTGVIAAATVAPGIALGSGHPKLAKRTAAELLVAVQQSAVQQLTGTVVETARLGLPDLPGANRAASLSWQSLITGSHTVRIWANGADQQRLAVIGQLSESDIVRSGRDLWTYTSSDNAVTHAILPAHAADRTAAPSGAPADAVALTPQAAATRALAAIDPSTRVAVDTAAEVAGRPAYTLSLTPRDGRSTIRRVLIAIDSKTSVPLRVQIFAGRARDAAFETAFTDVTFGAPQASVFRFSPPKGAVVTTKDLGGHRAGATSGGATPGAAAGGARPYTVLGAGWTAILRLTATPTSGATGTAPTRSKRSAASVLDRLFTTLHNGDRLLHTSLVNALITPDGRVFLGAVQPSLLEKAAGSAG